MSTFPTSFTRRGTLIGAAIDFGKRLHFLSRGRDLVRAAAYAPVSDDPLPARLDTQKFVQPFVHRGYRIVTKPLKRFSDGTMKGNFDVELAMDVLTMSDRLDIVCLVSGDGDFSRLVEIVGSKGVRVEVAAFGSQHLGGAAQHLRRLYRHSRASERAYVGRLVNVAQVKAGAVLTDQTDASSSFHEQL